MYKVQTPVILSVVNHRQNPLESTWKTHSIMSGMFIYITAAVE
jgi:hypothetical protein